MTHNGIQLMTLFHIDVYCLLIYAQIILNWAVNVPGKPPGLCRAGGEKAFHATREGTG